ncbi:Rieske 2Fe-2S domain-containing protein [Polaribacter aquimarinus]|uniref:Rieske domain-containing protein n=1 Tax=Polaribacter aquimarinus TaxID=2100726 RepID=A0A2U2JCT1_9FLAO|nr:Rieske 2Fe-2S domain-containing protein [Polaribacter aquimarinus]PWG06125.1 hypothetical protein DIS07_06755 [Polaribacter aquimarinus]
MIKKILVFWFLVMSFSCSDNTQINDCFTGINIFEILNLRLPAYQNLNIDGLSVTATINGRNIHIIRNNASNFIAFDLECPERNCNKPLKLNLPKIICECHNIEYNYLEGGRPINQEGCSMLMYSVSLKGNEALEIRN